MNYSSLHILNTLSIIFELLFEMSKITLKASKFIIIHSIVCFILIKELIDSIEWDVINEHRNTIGSWFIYESPTFTNWKTCLVLINNQREVRSSIVNYWSSSLDSLSLCSSFESHHCSNHPNRGEKSKRIPSNGG